MGGGNVRGVALTVRACVWGEALVGSIGFLHFLEIEERIKTVLHLFSDSFKDTVIQEDG